MSAHKTSLLTAGVHGTVCRCGIVLRVHALLVLVNRVWHAVCGLQQLHVGCLVQLGMVVVALAALGHAAV
jgi:hypothetical protein